MKKAKLLVVEDSRQLLRILEDILVSEFSNDAEILTARDGEEALTILKDSEINILITDQLMPRMDGDQLLANLRENGTFDKLQAAFIVTALFNVEDIQEKFSDVQVISKTDVFTELIPAVKSALHPDQIAA